jgi:DNA-binding IscR family transcriptional regulator
VRENQITRRPAILLGLTFGALLASSLSAAAVSTQAETPVGIVRKGPVNPPTMGFMIGALEVKPGTIIDEMQGVPTDITGAANQIQPPPLAAPESAETEEAVLPDVVGFADQWQAFAGDTVLTLDQPLAPDGALRQALPVRIVAAPADQPQQWAAMFGITIGSAEEAETGDERSVPSTCLACAPTGEGARAAGEENLPIVAIDTGSGLPSLASGEAPSPDVPTVLEPSSAGYLSFDAVVGGTAAIAAVGAALAALGYGIVTLYHRLGSDVALQHPVRSQIYELIQQRPGLRESEIAAVIGMDRTTARYHLQMLRRSGFLSSVQARSRTRYFVTGSSEAPKVAQKRALLEVSSAHALVRLAAEMPGIPLAQAARAAGMSRQLAHHHVKPLAEAGLLRLERGVGGQVLCFPPGLSAAAP